MTGRSVVQVVRSTSFAGVERYIVDVANELSRRGWAVTVVGGERRLMPAALHGVTFLPAATTWQAATALRRLGRSYIVHAHMTAAETAAVATRPFTRAHVVSTRHFAKPRGSGAARLVGWGVQRGIQREVAISQFVESAVGRRMPVIPNGVAASPSVRGSGQVVLAMQRLEREKDTGTLLRAFALSGLVKSGWSLRIAGRGQDRIALSHLATELGIGNAVDFLGFVLEPHALRSEAAFFVSTAPAEPFGLSVVEAMAAGLAVLCAEGGAHRETVGNAGLYFEPHDVTGCAEGLRRLALDEDLRRRLGRLGRERQQQLFTLERHVDSLEELYRSLG